MALKDELTLLAVQAVLDFARYAQIDWHGIYFRFYSADKNHSSCELTWRNQRELNPVKISQDYLRLLQKMMLGLFDEAERETGARPLVAVVDIQSDHKYGIQFDYGDPRALDISLTGLGTPKSYFEKDAIDIPEEIKEFQRDLAERGIEEMPLLYEPHKR